CPMRILPHHPIMRVETEERPAAAVQIDQGGLHRLPAAWVVDPDPNRSAAGCNRELARGGHLRSAPPPRRANELANPALLDWRHPIELPMRGVSGRYRGNELADFRIDVVR